MNIFSDKKPISSPIWISLVTKYWFCHHSTIFYQNRWQIFVFLTECYHLVMNLLFLTTFRTIVHFCCSERMRKACVMMLVYYSYIFLFLKLIVIIFHSSQLEVYAFFQWYGLFCCWFKVKIWVTNIISIFFLIFKK